MSNRFHRWARLQGSLALVGAAVIFMMSGSLSEAAPSPFRLTLDPDFVTLFEGEDPVLRYVRGEILAPGAPEDRRRSTYIHPLYSVDGLPLTDDFPADHLHHRGVSWMWYRVVCDGVTTDLWTLKGVRQRFERMLTPALYQNRAVLRFRNGWYQEADGKRILEEQVTLTAYRTDGRGRIIDVELLFSAQGSPVTLGVSNTGYSGFGVRIGPCQSKTILTSSGPITADENRNPHRWADFTARFTDTLRLDGIAVFDHPSNPNSPPGWTLRFYGYLNPAFTSRTGDYTIQPGEPLRLRYRLLVHRGRSSTELLEQIYQDFARRN
ncbi:MAG: hypothetical protein KatS3mg024_1006 [Armatimonadota bacterium]|nr:MAG: hypothetical protein KatS3mg024_1006 [Armatimonadota bacterium]